MGRRFVPLVALRASAAWSASREALALDQVEPELVVFVSGGAFAWQPRTLAAWWSFCGLRGPEGCWALCRRSGGGRAMSRATPFQLAGWGVVPCRRGRHAMRARIGYRASSTCRSAVLRHRRVSCRQACGARRSARLASAVTPAHRWLALVWANPSIERTCHSELRPLRHAAHVERWAPRG